MAGPDFEKALQKRKEISLTVTGRRTGKKVTFPVWFVVDGKRLFLLPVRGARTQWYKNVLVNPAITIRSDSQSQTFSTRAIDNPKAVGTVVEAFRKKYTAQDIARYYDHPNVAIEVHLA